MHRFARPDVRDFGQSDEVRRYLTAWILVGLLFGVIGFIQMLVAGGGLLVAAGWVPIPVVLTAAAGYLSYRRDARRGDLERKLAAQSSSPGLFGLLTNLASPKTIAFYLTLGSIITRAADAPALVSVALLLLGAGVFAVDTFSGRKAQRRP